MKKIILFLVCMLAFSIYMEGASEESVIDSVVQKDAVVKNVTIEVNDVTVKSGNVGVVPSCIVVKVRDILQKEQLPDGCYIYGEKYCNVQYGGDSFIEKQQQPNKEVKDYIEVFRDKRNEICLNIYPDKFKLGDLKTVLLKRAIDKGTTNPNWCADENNLLRITVTKSKSSDFQAGEGKNIEQNDSTDVVPTPKPDVLDDNKNNMGISLLIVLIIGFLVVVFLWNRLKQSAKKQAKEEDKPADDIAQEKPKGKPVDIAQVEQMIRKSTDESLSSIKNLFEKEVGKLRRSDDSIQSFINDVNARLTSVQEEQKLLKQMISEKKPCEDKVSQQDESWQGPELPEPRNLLDTDDVIVDYERSAFTLGAAEIKIFRIYSDGNDYYYTLIDDENVRRQFTNMLGGVYDSFITVTNPGMPGFVKVEPVQDGKLIKNGDIFIVDSNNKLQLTLK